jgi:hypothetical protein
MCFQVTVSCQKTRNAFKKVLALYCFVICLYTPSSPHSLLAAVTKLISTKQRCSTISCLSRKALCFETRQDSIFLINRCREAIRKCCYIVQSIPQRNDSIEIFLERLLKLYICLIFTVRRSKFRTDTRMIGCIIKKNTKTDFEKRIQLVGRLVLIENNIPIHSLKLFTQKCF